MDIKLDINTNQIKKSHGLGEGGRVQKFVDEQCLKLMGPYTPFKTGAMQGSATRATVIGSGKIQYTAPYARFQYYGKVMVDPDTGSTWAKKNGKKVLTDRNLKYNGAPKRGAFWFERMKADHKDEILREAAAVAGRKK